MNTVHKILDIFEHFLDEKGVEIQNEEKAESPDAAILYGTDYGDLYDAIEALIASEPTTLHVGGLNFDGKCRVAAEKIIPCIEATSADFDAWLEQTLNRTRDKWIIRRR